MIDTEARPNREDLEALAGGCDLLVIPTTPDALAPDALTQTVEALETIPGARYRILLTMCPPPPSRDADEAREMLQAGGLPVFAASIRRAVAFQKAPLAGVPVSELSDPRAAAAWHDYRQVGEELLR